MTFKFPNIPELEAEMIGRILEHPPSIFEVVDLVGERAFQNDLTRAIWKEMTLLAKGGTAVSMPAIRERVRIDTGKYGIPSLPAFLATCMQYSSGGMRLTDIAEIMTDRALSSDMSKLLLEVQKKAAAGQSTGEELAAFARSEIDKLTNAVRSPDTVSFHEAAEAFSQGVANSFKTGRPMGQDWGLNAINDNCGMIEDGDFIVLAGPSGHGKSSLLVQIMMHIALRRPVLLIQREMNPRAIAGRDVLGSTGISNSVIESGGMQASEVEQILMAAERYRNLPFEICYLSDMRISKIRTRLQAFIHRHGDCGLCAIDTIDHVDPEDKGARTDVEKIVSGSRALQQMGAEMGVPICGVAQVKVGYFDKVSADIQIHDIYGGGGLRNVADTVFLIHQPAQKMYALTAMTHPDRERKAQIIEEWRDMAQLKCVKRRRGRPGTGKLKWEGSRTRFSDPDDDQEAML